MASVRENILIEAANLTAGDRNKAYGAPHDNLTYMARLVQAYLFGKHNVDLELDSEDMAWIMLMAKVSRTGASHKHDNYVDASAYAAIAGECRQIITDKT
jgi:hypothetical protein